MNIEDIKLAVTPYLDKVAAFQTAQEIRDFLAAEGIRGFQNRPSACALAVYVETNSGEQIDIGLEVAGVWRFTGLSGLEGFGLPHTEAMQEFVKNFDAGFYPELVNRITNAEVTA